MYRFLKRFLLASLTIFFFLYLSLNAVANVAGLTDRLEKRVSDTLGKPIQLGFAYVDWSGQPRLSHFAMWAGPDQLQNRPLVRISDLEVRPAWTKIYDGQYDAEQFEFVRRVVFGHLDINLDQVPDSEQLFRSLPPVPARAPSWSIEYRNSSRTLLHLTGADMRYMANRKPVHLRIKQMNNRPFRALASMTFLPELNWQFDVEKGRLPEGIWPLNGDRWSGSIQLRTEGEAGRLTTDLEGSPGSFKRINLPEARLNADVTLRSDTTDINTVRLRSDYMDFDWSGTVARADTGRRVAMNGDLFMNLKTLGNYVLRDNGLNRLHVKQAYPMDGSFSLEGSLSAPELTGGVELRHLGLEINQPDTNHTLNFRNWAGELDGDTFQLTEGRVEETDNQFVLESGYLRMESARLLSSLTGSIEARTVPGKINRTFKQSVLGSLDRLSGRMNLSLMSGGNSTDFAFALRDGTTDFQRTQLSDVDFVTSFSSIEPIKTSLSGSFRGPDDNEWSIGGDHRSVRLKGDLKKVDALREFLFSDLQPFSGSPIQLSKVQAMVQVNDPFQTIDRYYGFLKFNGSRIGLKPNQPIISNLFGEVTVSPSTVDFNGIYGQVGEGKFQVSGQVSHDTGFRSGQWGVEFSGEELALANLTPEQVASDISGGISINGQVDGELTTPRLTSELSSSSVDYLGIPFRQLETRLLLTPSRFSFDQLEGRVGGGVLGGSGRGRFDEEFQTVLQINDMRLPRTFSRVSFLRDQTDGFVDAQMELGGNVARVNSWQGQLTLENRDVVLSRFPEIPGLSDIADPSALSQEIRVHDRRHNLPIRGGDLQFDSFKLTSKGIDLNAKGPFSMDGNMDLEFTLVLKEDTLRGYLQNILGNLYREVGLSDQPNQFKIPFYVRGTVSRPTIEFDDDQVAKRFREKLVQDIIPEKLGGQLMNEILEEILD